MDSSEVESLSLERITGYQSMPCSRPSVPPPLMVGSAEPYGWM
jgi:hypothetical protein